MPNLNTIVAFLTQASPWGAAALLFILGLALWFKHREAMKKLMSEDTVKHTVESLYSMLSAHVSCAESMAGELRSTASTELQVLNKIAQELVTLNARHDEQLISSDNAKLIINSQWAWVRDETARLIINSIENNNFRGNEILVARKVSRAWRKVARKSEEYLRSLSGLKYPYEALYSDVLPMLWARIWEWAIPVYHRDCPTTLEDSLFDLHERVLGLFEEAVAEHFDLVEDIDDGVIYNRAGPDAVRASAEYPMHDSDAEAAQMSDMLSQYQRGVATVNRPPLREEIRKSSGTDTKAARNSYSD